MNSRVATACLLAACWPLWWFAGLLEQWTSLDDLDLMGRVIVLFAFLSAAELVWGLATNR